MKPTLLLLVFTVLLLSCGDKKAESQESTLMEKTVDIHDELMNQMGKLTTLEAKLKIAIQDSTHPKIEKLESVQAANKAMFDWMRAFGNDFTFEEINKGHELTADKQELLINYYDQIVSLQKDFDALLQEEN